MSWVGVGAAVVKTGVDLYSANKQKKAASKAASQALRRRANCLPATKPLPNSRGPTSSVPMT